MRILLLMLIAAAVGTLLLSLRSKEKAPPPQVRQMPVSMLNSQGTGLSSFTAFPQKGSAYTIVRRVEGLLVEDNPDFLFDAISEESIIRLLENLEWIEDFGPLDEDEMEHLDDFGLGEDAFRLQANYEDGTQLAIIIGNRVPGEALADYMMFQGNAHLYAIAADLRETLDKPLAYHHRVPKVNFNPDLLEEIRMSGAVNLHLRRLASGYWEMLKPYAYPASAKKISQLLDSISAMRLATFVEPANHQSLGTYGLDKPAIHVVFSLASSTIRSEDGSERISVPAQDLAFAFGNRIAGLGYYCHFDGTIYQTSDLSMGFLTDADSDAFVSTSPIDLPLSFLTGFDIKANGRVSRYEVNLVESVQQNNEIARDRFGNLLYEFVILKDGMETKPEQAARLYGSMGGVRATGLLPKGYVPAEKPAVTMELRYPGGEREVSFYPYDALRYAISVEGHFVHYTDRHLLEGLAN